MPQPPDVGLFTRYVLENPWPLGIALLVLGLGLGWFGLREGRLDRVRLAVIPVLLAAAVLIAGWQIVTSGEQARTVTRQLVDAVVAEDLVGATNLFSDDARLHIGATTNVGQDVRFIISGLSRLAEQYTIEDNTITMLRGYTESDSAATVHLACWTDTGGLGPSRSQWVLNIVRQEDDSWKVSRLTWISLNGRPAPSVR